MPSNHPDFRHHRRQNTSTGVPSHNQSPGHAPLTPVVDSPDQYTVRPGITHNDRLRLNRFEETVNHSKGPPRKTTTVTSQKREYSVERTSPISSSTEPLPHPSHSRNLGTRDEALHSHPIRACVDHPSREPSQVDKSIKKQWRETAMYKEKDAEYTIWISPKTSTDNLGECQQERLFSTKASEDGFVWETQAQKEEIKSEKKVNFTIPVIRITPPSESSGDEADQLSPSTNSAHRALHEAEKENSRLRRRLRKLESLIPLAQMIAKTEGIDVNDSVGLKKGLEIMIQDLLDLSMLVPLADRLCAYLGISCDPESLETLPPALDKILGDLKKANSAAAYYKRVAERTKGRIRQLLRLHNDKGENSEQ